MIQPTSEMHLMEQNLAKLLHQHHSLPQLPDAEPPNPFQKAAFLKKMNKSKTDSATAMSFSLHHSTSTYQSASSAANPSQLVALLEEASPSKDPHEQEVERLFAKLRSKEKSLEKLYKEKLRRMRRCEEDLSKEMDEMIGFLEGSVEFIINDCLREPEAKAERQSSFESDNNNNKENFSLNRGNENKEKNLCKKGQNKPDHRSKEKSGKTQKSIYEAVLEEREKRGRKKMI